jgi:hypothetical protein
MALTNAILNDLNTGNSVLKLLPYTAGGVNLAASGGIDFSSADEIFTLENSFQISKDAPSFTSTKIDQKHRVIESAVEAGENYTMTGNIPSIAIALLDLAFESVSGAVTVKDGTDTYTSTAAHKYGSLEKEYTVLARSQSGDSAVVFARVKFVFSEPQHDDNTTPTYVQFNAVMLPNESASGDFVALPTHTVTNNG